MAFVQRQPSTNGATRLADHVETRLDAAHVGAEVVAGDRVDQ
jgi:hypothetical protein